MTVSDTPSVMKVKDGRGGSLRGRPPGMMPTLAELFHDADTFLALESEDVAAVLMDVAQQFRVPPQSKTGWPIFWPASAPYAPHEGYGTPGGLDIRSKLSCTLALCRASVLKRTQRPNDRVRRQPRARLNGSWQRVMLPNLMKK